MAGSYPDVPGYRFAYDVDGTVVVQYYLPSGIGNTINSSLTKILNNDNPAQSSIGDSDYNYHVAFLFPELRDISGIVLAISDRSVEGGTIKWSNDTTDGIDGTWTQVATLDSICGSYVSRTYLRSNITSLSITGAKAIRLSDVLIAYRRPFNIVHLYGSISTSESPDRLRVVDISDSDIAAQLDFGNIKQRANSTKQFKVVNNSSTLTANNITVSLDAPYDSSPSLVGQYQISTDNVAFANAINIGSLAPGANSVTLYIKNAVANNAQLGLWSLRIIAHPTSWS